MTKERFEKLVGIVLKEIEKIPNTVTTCDGQILFEDYGHYQSLRYTMKSGNAYMALPTLITLQYKDIKLSGCFDAGPNAKWIVFESDREKVRAEKSHTGDEWTVSLLEVGNVLAA